VHDVVTMWYMCSMGKKKHLQPCPTHKHMVKRLRLVKKLENTCIICGCSFTSLECVTFDHLVPKSMGGGKDADNLLAVHFRCNQNRGDSSIVAASKRMKAIEQEMGPERFMAWVNSPVPLRNFPVCELNEPRCPNETCAYGCEAVPWCQFFR